MATISKVVILVVAKCYFSIVILYNIYNFWHCVYEQSWWKLCFVNSCCLCFKHAINNFDLVAPRLLSSLKKNWIFRIFHLIFGEVFRTLSNMYNGPFCENISIIDVIQRSKYTLDFVKTKNILKTFIALILLLVF